MADIKYFCSNLDVASFPIAYLVVIYVKSHAPTLYIIFTIVTPICPILTLFLLQVGIGLGTYNNFNELWINLWISELT